AGASEPVERRRCALSPAGRLGKRLLRPAPPSEDRLESLVARRPRRGHLCAAGIELVEPPLELGRVGCGEARAQPRNLPAELLCPFRRRRLERERPEPLRDLLLEVAGALGLDLDACEL